MYGDFTMETILAAAFGCEANVQQGEGNEITHAAKMVFGSTTNPKLLPLSIVNLIFILGEIFSGSTCNLHRHTVLNY